MTALDQAAFDRTQRRVRIERSTDTLHDAEVVGEIVDGVERGGERLAGLHQMAQIGARVAAADGAGAGGIGRGLVLSKLLVLDVEAALAGEEQSVAGGAGGKNAIHHVDAEAGVLLDFVGVADAHDVARLVFGQQRQNFRDHFKCQLARLADAEATDGVAVEVHLDEAFGALAAEIAVHAALNDSEEGLRAGFAIPRGAWMGPLLLRSRKGSWMGHPLFVLSLIEPRDFIAVSAEVIERAARPGHSEAEAFFGAGAISGILGALVESHDDVGAESDLNVDGMFRSEEVRAAIEVGAELDAVVSDFAERVEREDLEAAGVSEDGARPTHEFVKPAHAANGFVARDADRGDRCCRG